MKTIVLGNFETDGMIRVTDPCYNRKSSGTGILKVKPGRYNCQIVISNEGAWGERVKELVITHDSIGFCYSYKDCTFEIGVDSGQAGFFDENHFPDEKGEFGDENSWYYKCCLKTGCGDPTLNAGVITGGVVSSSGYGDGTYRCQVALDTNKEIIGAKIIFIDDA